jgi:sugar phosphate isomerase/epimerase
MIAIENMYECMAFSRGDQMKEIFDKSREKFTNWLINEKKMDKKKAEEIAHEKIGMTWDVGHLNIMKKSGFNDEDLVKETQKVKDYVKHIHLTDNFGYADTHLPPGMGNVPFKQLLEELEKNGQYKI